MSQVIAPQQQIAPISVTKPVVAIGLTTLLLTLGGFAVLAIAAFNLAQVFRTSDPLIAMMMFGMITIAISDIMLLRLLSRIVRAALEGRPVAHLPKAPPREVPKQLSPRLEPVPSVTENTTRTFTPLFRESSDRGTK